MWMGAETVLASGNIEWAGAKDILSKRILILKERRGNIGTRVH